MSLRAVDILGRTGAPLYHLTPSALCPLKIFFLYNAAACKTSFSPSFRKKTCSGREPNLIFQTAFSAARRTPFYSEDIHVPADCEYFGADGGAVMAFNPFFRSLLSQNIFSTILLPAKHRFPPSFRKKTCSGREPNLIFQTAFSAARRTPLIYIPFGLL